MSIKSNIKIMSIVHSAMLDDCDNDYTPDMDDNISPNGLALVNISGVIGKRLSEMDKMNGGIDVDDISYVLKDLINDSSVTSILLVFNSPGGEVTGVPELGKLITECSLIKPTFSFTDTICASAAYWLASCTDGIFVTPSAHIGSIGVFSLFENHVGELEQAGIKIESFSAGKYKLLGNPFTDMTPDEMKIVQDSVDEVYRQFTTTVTSNRSGVDNETMQGLLYTGTEALNNNLVDGVYDSLDDLIAELDKPLVTTTTNDNNN